MLDNCEHLIDACAKTADPIWRRCPGVHLLATSREPLGIGGETIYRVPPVPARTDEPTARVRRRGRAVRRAGPEQDIASRRRGRPARGVHLPAAGRYPAGHRARGGATAIDFERLRDRLDQRFRLLTGGKPDRAGPATDPSGDRRLVLFAARRPEQVLLAACRYSLGASTSTPPKRSAATGDIEVFDVADLLGSLVDKSLVVAKPAGGNLR